MIEKIKHLRFKPISHKDQVPIPEEPVRCLNCGTVHQGRYCHECGQSSATKRFTIKEVLHSISKTIFKADRGFFFTVFSLFRSPGDTINNYVEGKRVKYFPPFPLLVITAAFYGLVNKIFTLMFGNITTHGDSIAVVSSKTETIESTISRSSFFSLTENFLSHKFGLLILLMIPVFVMSLRVCFGNAFRSKYNVAETYVIAAFIDVQFFGVLTIFTVLAIFFPILDQYNIIVIALFMAVIAWDMTKLSNLKRKISNVWRAIGTYSLFLLLLILIIIGLSIIMLAICYLVGGMELVQEIIS